MHILAMNNDDFSCTNTNDFQTIFYFLIFFTISLNFFNVVKILCMKHLLLSNCWFISWIYVSVLLLMNNLIQIFQFKRIYKTTLIIFMYISILSVQWCSKWKLIYLTLTYVIIRPLRHKQFLYFWLLIVSFSC